MQIDDLLAGGIGTCQEIDVKAMGYITVLAREKWNLARNGCFRTIHDFPFANFYMLV
jgi:hypothetical protein